MMQGLAVWDFPVEEKAKKRGMKLSAQAAHRESALAKEAAMRAWKRLGRPISSDDIRDEAPELFKDLPPGKKANFMGGIWTRDWVAVGRVKSRTPGSHANELRTWRPK